MLAVAFVGETSIRGGRPEAVAGARLAAESGMDYARIRLDRDPFPLHMRTLDNRTDDWTFREGVQGRLGTALNPSYARGEPWQDADADGRFDPGETPVDPDGDGRFSARSGRLRAGSGAVSFSLKIESVGEKLCVNEGGAYTGPLPYQILPYEHLLNSLGAILLAPNPAIGRVDYPAGGPVPGEPIRMSRLGTQILGRRPLKGYRSLDEVSQTLLSLGYSAGDCDRILPFLCITSNRRLNSQSRSVPFLEFQTIPREILQAVWMYVQAQHSLDSSDSSGQPNAALWQTPYGAPGIRSGGNLPIKNVALMMYPDEAGNLADWAVDFRRRTASTSWRALREDMIAHAPAIFATDASLFPPAARDDWIRAKADWAFFCVSCDPPAFRNLIPIASGWGIDHGLGPAPGGFPRPFFAVDLGRAEGPVATGPLLYPDTSGIWANPNDPYMNRNNLYGQIWMTLAPPVQFQVESLGGTMSGASCARLSGTLAVSARIDLAAQEDFENVGLGKSLGLSGVRAVTEGARPALADTCLDFATGAPVNPVPVYPGTSSFPLGNVRGFLPNQMFNTPYGAIALAGRACGPQGARQYWAFHEDADPSSLAEFTSVSAAVPPFQLPAPVVSTPAGPQHDPARFSPWHFTGTATPPPPSGWLPFAVPGIKVPFISAHSEEFWARPDGGVLWKVTGQVASWHWSWPVGLQLTASPEYDPVLGPGSRYQLSTAPDWVTQPASLPQQNMILAEGFVPDVDPAGTRARFDQDHVVFTFAADPAGTQTAICLYVNGLLLDSRTYPVIFRYTVLSQLHSLTFNGCDEIRLYDQLLQPQDVRDRYELGRYVLPPLPSGGPNPSYRSPLYVLDAPGRLKRANWTGIPAGDPPGQERIGIRVRVRGYSDAAGSVEVPASPLALADTFSLSDLSDLGPVRSFRYEVEFHNLTPAGVLPSSPLYRTPVFESIWFTLARAGQCGWSDRTAD